MAEIDWPSSCGPQANAHPPPPIAHAPTPIGVNSISLLPSRFCCISSTITKLMHPAKTRAVVIGSGPNGLAAAIVLARAGQAVTLYEGAPTIGGGARSAELTLPGFVHDICSAVHPLAVCSPCFEQFPLAAHGLEWVHPDAPLAHPLDDGSAVLLERSIDSTAAGLGPDGEAWRRLVEPLVDAWPRRPCPAIRSRWRSSASTPFAPGAPWRRPISAARAPAPCLPAWRPTPPCRSKRAPAPPSAWSSPSPRTPGAGPFHAAERSASATPWPAASVRSAVRSAPNRASRRSPTPPS